MSVVNLQYCLFSQRVQSIKSDIRKPIDKSLSIDKIIMIDIDCIDKNQFSQLVFPKSIDFIDSGKFFENVYMFC